MRFGRLKVLYESEAHYSKSGTKIVTWRCRCDCGNEKDIRASNLQKGTMSCGCAARELASARLKKTNIYDISNSYEIGYTLKNEPFFFDIEDYDLIKNYCWRLRSDGYLDAKIPRTDNRILMHNLIMNHRYIDHINGIRHDNRKINLRLSDNQYGFDTYNQMNKRVQSNNKSGCPGVCWHSRDKIWEVHISVDNKLLYLGRYSSYEDAVCARKRSEEKIFKDWSYDNSQKIGRNTNVIV